MAPQDHTTGLSLKPWYPAFGAPSDGKRYFLGHEERKAHIISMVTRLAPPGLIRITAVVVVFLLFSSSHGDKANRIAEH